MLKNSTASDITVESQPLELRLQVSESIALPLCSSEAAKFDVGPLRPVVAFPPVVFTTAFDLAHAAATAFRKQTGTPMGAADYLGLIKVAFDLNMKNATEPGKPYLKISALSESGAPFPHLVLETADGYIIDPSRKRDPHRPDVQQIYFGPKSSHPLVASGAPLMELEPSLLSTRVAALIDAAIQSRLTSGHRSLVFSTCAMPEESMTREIAGILLAGLVNSPYFSALEERPSGDKTNSRFRVIDMLHSLREHPEETDKLIALIERRPSMICLRGWCGGTMLHESAEYGNVKLTNYLIDKIFELDEADQLRNLTTGEKYTAEQVINFENRDGSTALQLAELHSQRQIIPLLLSVFADSRAENRFGEPMLSHDVDTGRLTASPISAANHSKAIALIRDAFSEAKFEKDRAVAEFITKSISEGDRSLLVGEAIAQYVGAYLWERESTPIAFAQLGIDVNRPDRIWLAYFGVAREAQAQGYGSEILAALARNCSRFGARELVLQTSSLPDNARVRAFYVANGFRKLMEDSSGAVPMTIYRRKLTVELTQD
jgi:GNAT superfamily N-acetyltransferase